MFDHDKRIEQPMAHTASDLKVCHDIQLPNDGRIVEESIVVNR